MIRTLKNRSRNTVSTTVNGRSYTIGPKKSIGLDETGMDRGVADYLLYTFGFLYEITPENKPDIAPLEDAIPEKVKKQ